MKILCLDGGGIRGVFAVSFLNAIEKEWNYPISELFDVIAGTSTGSIIATSVILKNNMDELLSSYKKYGEKIFIRQAKVGLFKSVYSDQYLRTFIQKAFGNVALVDIKKPLLIPAVDVTHGKPYVYRSNYGHPESEDLTIKLWDAVLSSCSAPVYFPPNNIKNRYLSIDGGLWANNPSLVCVTEAMHHFNKSLDEINILSVGTGRQMIHYEMRENKFWGVKNWLPVKFGSLKVQPKLLDLALDLSSESVSYHCSHLLKEQYVRINEELGTEIPFDDVKCMDALTHLGRAAFEKRKAKLKQFLFN